ncbi:hypothetical protein LCGC14_1845220, partial [marine sediment metagenome]
SIRKKFRVDKDQLQNLREKLINLRYERAYQIILSLSIDEELLNRLKRFSNSLIMNPIIIDEIKTKLIKFDIPYSDDASLADIFTFAARGLNPRDLYIIDKALNNALQRVINDKIKTVTVCGLGIDEGNLDPKTIARITAETCNRYNRKIEIKIIDNNKVRVP